MYPVSTNLHNFGALPVLYMVQALEAAKKDCTEDDVFDALVVKGIKGEPFTID